MAVELEVPAASAVTDTSTASAAPASTTSTPAREPSKDLEASVASKMASVFGNSDEDEEVIETPAAVTVEETPAAEATPTEESTEAADAGEQTAETPSTPAKVNPAAQVIPAAYERSLKAYGWTADEIKDAYKADPANFLRTAAKFHENRNEETRRMSELGRMAKAQADAQAIHTPAPASVPAKFTPLDIEALKKTYGKDEPFIKQLEQLNGVVDFANQMMPWMKQSQARQRDAEMQTLGRQIDTFFTGKDLEPYTEAYGKSAAELKPEQMQARQKVLETADLLIRGAKVSGRTLPLEEALTLAHDSVSGPVKTQAVRAKIVAQVKTRQAAISLKPGARSGAPAIKADRSALEGKVGKGLAAAFGR